MHSTYFIHGFRFTPTVPQLASQSATSSNGEGKRASAYHSRAALNDRLPADRNIIPEIQRSPKKSLPSTAPPLACGWPSGESMRLLCTGEACFCHRSIFYEPLPRWTRQCVANVVNTDSAAYTHTNTCTCSRKDKRPKQHTSATWHRYMAYEHGVGCRCWGVPSVLQKDTWTGRWASSASLGSSSAGMHSTGDDALCWFLPHVCSEFDCEEDWLVQCYEMQCSWHLTTQLGSELMRVERVHGGKIAVTTCCYCYMRFYGAVRKQGNGDIRWSKATIALR